MTREEDSITKDNVKGKEESLSNISDPVTQNKIPEPSITTNSERGFHIYLGTKKAPKLSIDRRSEDVPLQQELIKPIKEEANGSSNSFLKFLGIFALLLVILASTNPPKSNYVSWANDKIMERSTSGLASGLLSLFGNPVITATTTSNNMYICTVFTTTIGKNKVITLGIFNQFIPISSN